MTIGFLTAQNIVERITNGIKTGEIGPIQYFSSWIDGSQCAYYEVPEEFEPDIGEFWGYCVGLDFYFISANVQNSAKTAILQMEDYRIEGSRHHAEAVAFAVSQPQKYRGVFVETLLRYYRTKQSALADCVPDTDIDATVEFLTSPHKN